MIGLLRRVGFALGVAVLTGSVLRFTKPPVVPLRRGGWRPLEPPQFR